MRARELTLLPASRLAYLEQCWRAYPSAAGGGADKLTSPASTQAWIQGSELAHPNIYIICELLLHLKGWFC